MRNLKVHLRRGVDLDPLQVTDHDVRYCLPRDMFIRIVFEGYVCDEIAIDGRGCGHCRIKVANDLRSMNGFCTTITDRGVMPCSARSALEEAIFSPVLVALFSTNTFSDGIPASTAARVNEINADIAPR